MIGVFVLSTGQPTYRDTVNSIKEQDVPIMTVENVQPVNKAINICFDMARDYGWEYFLIMGADTVHYQNSLAIMWRYMKKGLWSVYGKLDDYYRGSEGYGNHLYNLEAIKDYRVDESDPLYDHKIHADMEKDGYKKVITDEVIGVHHPVWTPEEAFSKHYFSGMRYSEKYQKKYLSQVEDRVMENHHPVNIAARAGFLEGINAKDNKRPLTMGAPKIWDKYKDEFNNKDKLVWKNYA